MDFSRCQMRRIRHSIVFRNKRWLGRLSSPSASMLREIIDNPQKWWRFTETGKTFQIRVINNSDWAHEPTGCRASVSALRSRCKSAFGNVSMIVATDSETRCHLRLTYALVRVRRKPTIEMMEITCIWQMWGSYKWWGPWIPTVSEKTVTKCRIIHGGFRCLKNIRQ
jgi:hypothetical protein